MKTIQEIDKEIDELRRSIKKDSTEKEIKAVKSKIPFLMMCKRYLETSPRKEFIQSQLDEVQRKIELIPSHYPAWQVGKVLTKYKDPYATYCNEMKMPDLKAQVKTLQFILDGTN